MNYERIKDLELEAAYGIIDPNEPFTAEEFHNFTKKFAELIVRECDVIATDCNSDMTAAEVLKHFGVEE